MKTLVHFLKYQFGLVQAETSVTKAEWDCMALHASGRRCLVEIGVWHGVTTCRLRQVMAPDGILYAVDPYPVGRIGISMPRRIAHSEVGRVRNGRVQWVRETGSDAAQGLAAELVGRVEFVFIDGDHSYDGLRSDWEGWSGLVAPGGSVALHDSRSSPARRIDDAGSVRFASEVILADPRYEVADTIDSLTVLRRRPS
jgi:predicted O-methyltransferase YrrM